MNTPFSKFGISQSAARVEDVRLLTGHGRYTDDIAPEGALHMYVLRAQMAHATLTGIDTEAAKSAPGVRGVYLAADLDGVMENSMTAIPVKNLDGSTAAVPHRPALAINRVRFVGEAIAVIVADTLQQARDAAETILVDYDDLPTSMALEFGGPEIHPDAPENLAYDWGHGDAEATEAAFQSAAHQVKLRVHSNRVIANSMEPRACYAEMEGDRLHVCFSGQGVWGVKRHLAGSFNLAPEEIRVTNPDVGGGFGMKVHAYPEYLLAAFATKTLGQPVRWTPDRSESMLTDNACRDLYSDAQAAFDENYKLVALRVNAVSNLGAYSSGFGQNIQSELALKVFPGVYDVQTAYFGVRGIYTNTTPVDAYRGAGRPEAIYVLERLFDHAARTFQMDPSELRRRSFIRADQMPYKTAAGELYDVGDFDRVLTRAETEADVAGFPARQQDSVAKGKLRGLGLCFYIESILGAPKETTRIEFAEDGQLNLYVGTQSNGQGHETAYTQLLCEKTGWNPAKVRIIQGDSDAIPTGGGTGGSRSVTMQGNSIYKTSDLMIKRLKPLASDELEVNPQDVAFEKGAFAIVGTDRRITLPEVVEKARKTGQQDLLDHSVEYDLPARSYPNGAHFCEVEVDPQTGHTQVVKYTIVDDFGLLINPMLAEGQVHGGVVQGIGQAITENAVYDDSGQLLTGSFMDYGMPRASDIPTMAFHTELVPSTANEIGMKGCGEAGTVGAMAAVMNAVQDALWDRGVRQVDMPVTPLRMWEWLQQAK
ncbi:xanthine dehydrogenase family protein molybdopterin-binding subunit [Neptunicoccus cionae]|uniref:Carbon monoxide dehydrogenase n=1 Tax=Neptunicoccus cionae TaxID=2035344 RepID=A0A916VNA8_9RHOB|nr:xanthine dehydrogenase family protein molybdopterin-binding subunit [Amylibacter cionae]GGA12533.1 carbon monoxide dehydrogenase [Amylibacter cionae]